MRGFFILCLGVFGSGFPHRVFAAQHDVPWGGQADPPGAARGGPDPTAPPDVEVDICRLDPPHRRGRKPAKRPDLPEGAPPSERSVISRIRATRPNGGAETDPVAARATTTPAPAGRVTAGHIFQSMSDQCPISVRSIGLIGIPARLPCDPLLRICASWGGKSLSNEDQIRLCHHPGLAFPPGPPLSHSHR